MSRPFLVVDLRWSDRLALYLAILAVAGIVVAIWGVSP